MTTVLIDGDLVAYRAAASAENDPDWVAISRAEKTLIDILSAIGTDNYKIFLTSDNNFRRTLDPNYKANRTAPKPQHLQLVKELLVSEWKATIADGCEADDYLGIYQTDDTIIASIDKDLQQIPGKHYNFVKQELFEVTPLEGLRFFYKQTLIGDTSDNIFGIYGIGPKKASKLIDGLTTEEEMYHLCRKMYKDDNRFHLNCKLLYILREFDKIWEPSKELLAYYDQQEQQQEVKSETSDLQKMVSSENIGQEISGSNVSGTTTETTV